MIETRKKKTTLHIVFVVITRKYLLVKLKDPQYLAFGVSVLSVLPN